MEEGIKFTRVNGTQARALPHTIQNKVVLPFLYLIREGKSLLTLERKAVNMEAWRLYIYVCVCVRARARVCVCVYSPSPLKKVLNQRWIAKT